MKKRLLWTAFLVSAFLIIGGCDTALTVGNKTVGVQSGRFIYTEGYLRTTYNDPLEKVWEACEQTLSEMKATDVERIRKIARGNFAATIQDDKVRISVEYVEKNVTAVSVMVGMTGNNIASQVIQDRLAKILAAMP